VKKKSVAILFIVLLLGLFAFFYWKHKMEVNAITSPATQEVTAESEEPDLMPEPRLKAETVQPSHEASTLSSQDNTPVDLILNQGTAHLEFKALGSLISHFQNQLKTTPAGTAFHEDGSYKVENLERSYKKKLIERMSQNELKDLVELTKHPLMQDFAKGEEAFLSDEGQEKAMAFAKALSTKPLPEERVKALEELDSQGHFSVNTLATMNTLSETLKQITKKTGRQVLNLEMVSKGTMLRLANTLEGKSNEDIHALTRLIESPVKQKETVIRQESILENLHSLTK
jgi:hypothetical protein